MRGINKVILVGNLGKDPDVQYLEGGTALAKFTLATSESYKDKNGNRVDQTEWHNIIVWRGLAEVAEKYLKKGSKIYLEGKIRSRSWDDKETGVKKYATDIVGDNFIMLDSKDQGSAVPTESSKVESTSSAEKSTSGEVADDLPF